MLKIDTHAHYLPYDWPDLAQRHGDPRFAVLRRDADGRARIYKDGRFFREIWANTWDPEMRIAEYAQFGVQVQVISTVPVMFRTCRSPGPFCAASCWRTRSMMRGSDGAGTAPARMACRSAATASRTASMRTARP